MLTRVVFLVNLLVLAIPSYALYFLGSPKSLDETTASPSGRFFRRDDSSQSPQPIISVTNTTDWPEETGQLCMNAINISTVNNPAGVVPCYNVLSWDPNTGNFLSEVRIFQVMSLEQPSILDRTTGSGIMFEFPYASVTSGPSDGSFSSVLGKREVELSKRQNPSMGQVNNTSAFYLNGTADLTQNGISVQQLLTPTTATLTLNISGTPTPFGMTGSMIMFVNGLFSPQFQGVAPNTTATLSSSHQPSPAGFVLPGISFGIVPIGFYMFSAYWGVFTVVIILGAWSKRKYRDAFRRRRAAVLNSTVGKRV